MFSRPPGDHLVRKEKDLSPQSAAVGTIMNLFTSDINVIGDAGSNTHQLWASVPMQVIIAIVLLYKTLGISAFSGVALMAGMVPMN